MGRDRLDSVAQTLATNRLYEMMWIYYNLFQPVMHLKEKQVIRQEGQPTRVLRRHDDARTPFDRLCVTDCLLPEHRALLEALRDQINPRLLRQQIYDALDVIFSLPGASPGVAQDVRQTLLTPNGSDNGRYSLRDFAFNRTKIGES